MKVVVQKYGGSSVATVDKLKIVAQKVVDTKRAGFAVVVVVSAMGDTTDELLNLARQVSDNPQKRELDMLLSVGERISMALLSCAIHTLGEQATSLTGSQCGILTTDSHANARIMEVRPFRIQDELEKGHIVIVAGYQGTSYKREVTTLGRGGSDTTAVALAAALGAEHCDIYSDVDGIFSTDPRIVPTAQKLIETSYTEMQELARLGARVLNPQAVEFARRKQVAIYARSTHGEGAGTVIRRVDGVVEAAERVAANFGVTGVAGYRGVAVVSFETSGTGSNETNALLEQLADAEVLATVAMPRMDRIDVVIGLENIPDAAGFCSALRRRFVGTVTVSAGLCSVAAVGNGVGGEAGAIRRLWASLDAASLAPVCLFATRDSVVAVLEAGAMERGMRTVHAAFELGEPAS